METCTKLRLLMTVLISAVLVAITPVPNQAALGSVRLRAVLGDISLNYLD